VLEDIDLLPLREVGEELVLELDQLLLVVRVCLLHRTSPKGHVLLASEAAPMLLPLHELGLLEWCEANAVTLYVRRQLLLCVAVLERGIEGVYQVGLRAHARLRVALHVLTNLESELLHDIGEDEEGQVLHLLILLVQTDECHIFGEPLRRLVAHREHLGVGSLPTCSRPSKGSTLIRLLWKSGGLAL